MTVYDRQTLATTAELAAVAASAHTDAGGTPIVEPVTPLLLDGSPAFTLTSPALTSRSRSPLPG
jgi:hypothetical protein